MDENEISRAIIGAAIEVHRTLGPGLLESIYESALSFELQNKGFEVQQQQELPVVYKGTELGGNFRIDLLISDLGLPDQSGLELMKELRRRGNTIKGIALRGYGQKKRMCDAARGGVQHASYQSWLTPICSRGSLQGLSEASESLTIFFHLETTLKPAS